MALSVEDGTGKPDADCTWALTDHDAYQSARSNAAWDAAAESAKESAIRAAADYMMSVYGPRLYGGRTTGTQRLDWPRVGAPARGGGYLAEDAIPRDWQEAEAEFAGRALTGSLGADQPRGGRVKKSVVGPIEQEFMDGAPAETSYPSVTGRISYLLAPKNVGTVVRA